MTNVEFSDVSELRDLEALFFYHDEMRKGVKSRDEIMRAINLKSRDNARTPMQWSGMAAISINIRFIFTHI